MVIGDLEKYRDDIGYTTKYLSDSNGDVYLVIEGVSIASGQLIDKTCDVAVRHTGANPWVPPAALQIRPHLVPTGRHSTQASPLGTEWQYWSRRFDRAPTPRSFLAHIFTVLGEV